MNISTLNRETDINKLAELINEFWPEGDLHYHLRDIEKIMRSEKDQLWIVHSQNQNIAFAHVSIRYEYVEGSSQNPVAYLEGIFVRPEFRLKGIATQLLKSAKKWAKSKRCLQLASDAELSNTTSHLFHSAAGFHEVTRIICYIQDI